MQSVWLIILRSGNTRIKWLEMILRIKAQKKFIIFAFKKLHNAAYGIFETGYGSSANPSRIFPGIRFSFGRE